MADEGAVVRTQWTLGGVVVVLACVVAACGGDVGGPTSPSLAGGTTTASNTASILSCNSVRYQNQSFDVCRPVQGQSNQPIGSAHYFPGRSDCLKVSCGGGCATAVSVGVVVGGSCQ